MFIKDVHYSTELEMAILGSIVLEQTAFGRVYGILQADVFYHDHHQLIFNSLQSMWEDNQPIDIITATIYISKKGTKTLNGSSVPYYMVELTKAVCSTSHLEYHALLLREMYVEREMIKLTTSGLMGKEGVRYMDELQDKLIKLRQVKNTDDFKDIDDILIELYQNMDKAKGKELAGITTGIKQLDKISGGFEVGGMYILGARPSVGKSALMGKMVLGAALKGAKVGIISLEMEDTKITARIASMVSEIDFWRINRNRMTDQDQSNRFYQIMASELSHLPIKISDKASVNIGDIKSKVARLKQRNEIDILFIDYLGLIDTDGGNRNANREQEVSKISRGVKLMAMQYEIPVVLLCQLNRATDKEAEKKPKLHNLRESGSLEQDADGVLFLHRDFMAGIKTNEKGQSTENEADLIIAKWRNGELAEIKLGFDGPKMKFYELWDQSTVLTKSSTNSIKQFEEF